MFKRKEDSEESSQEESVCRVKCEYQATSPGASLRTRPKTLCAPLVIIYTVKKNCWFNLKKKGTWLL